MTLFLTSLAVVTLLCASMDKLEAEYLALSKHQNSSSFMRLPNASSIASISFDGGDFVYPSFVSSDDQHKFLLPNLDGGLFLPILSSPSFNSLRPGGFSFGFYSWCKIGDSAAPCYVYMAVCAGSSGHISNDYYGVSNGFAVPVWIANLDHPMEIRIPVTASLDVVVAAPAAGSSDQHVLELQLRGDKDVVYWNVSNVGLMEMSDYGYFSIYNQSAASPTSGARPVFQSTTVDTLVEGQRLTEGMQLTSNDSAYSAKMEKGGLVLVLNSMGPQAPPYWIFPFLRSDNGSTSPNLTMNKAISSAPACNDSYLHTQKTLYYLDVLFETGSCTGRVPRWYAYGYSSYIGDTTLSWSFLRQESDGRLYAYAAVYSNSATAWQVITRQALSSNRSSLLNSSMNTLLEPLMSRTGIMQDVGTDCDVPLACGPLAICTPGVKSICACPNPQNFEPIDTTDITQGCKPAPPLPSCAPARASGHKDSILATSFLELKSTANIFLLTRWKFSTDTVDGCKQACSLDCSCHGVSYQVSTSFCFLITHNISLLAVIDANVTLLSLSPTKTNLTSRKKVLADDYVTYLKVASLTPATSSKLKVPMLSKSKVLMLALVGILFVSVVICGMGGYRIRKRRKALLQQAKQDEELHEVLPLLPTRFSHKELQVATKGFSKLLGAGGCGSVYAGTLLDGREVAVKVLEGVLQGARQSKEFLAEVAAVGRTGHHNIVRLVGFCWQVSHRILVYEYVERGSLDRLLFDWSNKEDLLLDWQKRYDIVLGVARGLHYLHEECEQPILHFDIKPHNILLNDALVAKISDFGMSRLMRRNTQSTTVTDLRGTIGYIAPEWLSRGTASKKCDVYSFGVVMLEIVAGRKVLDSSLILDAGKCSSVMSSVSVEQDEAWHLPSWAAKKWEQGCLMDIVDPRLLVCGFDEVQVRRLLYIALWCIHEDPSVRPHAATLVQWLEYSLPVQTPPISTS